MIFYKKILLFLMYVSLAGSLIAQDTISYEDATLHGEAGMPLMDINNVIVGEIYYKNQRDTILFKGSIFPKKYLKLFKDNIVFEIPWLQSAKTIACLNKGTIVMIGEYINHGFDRHAPYHILIFDFKGKLLSDTDLAVDEVKDFAVTNNGNIYLSGNERASKNTNVFKVDMNGEIVWKKVIENRRIPDLKVSNDEELIAFISAEPFLYLRGNHPTIPENNLEIFDSNGEAKHKFNFPYTTVDLLFIDKYQCVVAFLYGNEMCSFDLTTGSLGEMKCEKIDKEIRYQANYENAYLQKEHFFAISSDDHSVLQFLVIDKKVTLNKIFSLPKKEEHFYGFINNVALIENKSTQELSIVTNLGKKITIR